MRLGCQKVVPALALLACWTAGAAGAAGQESPPGPPRVTAAPRLVAQAPAQTPPGDESVSPSPTPQPDNAEKYRQIEQRPIAPTTRSQADTTAAPAAGGSGWFSQTALALVAVLALIVLSAWALKRWGPASLRAPRGGPFEMLARWHLAGRQYVALIRVGRRMLLIGVTGQQISLLADISDPDEMHQLLDRCQGGGGGRGSRSILTEGFDQLLGGKRREMGEQADADDPGAPRLAGGSAGGQLAGLLEQIKSRLSRLRTEGKG